MPALQRDACRQCVACGVIADQFCARCGVTPYCSARCQRRDWNERHRTVCHNLARLSTLGTETKDATDSGGITAAAPLRRPYTAAVERDPRKEDTGFDRGHKNYRQNDRNPNAANRPNQRTGGPHNIKNQERNNYKSRNDNERDNMNQSPQAHVQRNETSNVTPKNIPMPKLRSPKSMTHDTENVPVPVKEKPAVREEVKPVVTEVQHVAKEEFKPTVKEVKPSCEVKAMKKSTLEVVPKTYLIENLSIGDVVLLSVDCKASECRTTQRGFVCLSMHEKYEMDYQKLCEDYVVDCEADTTELVLTPGVSLSYLNPEDGGWYRARCLNPTIIALVDSSKIIELKPTDKLKILPAKYQEIPEFSCVLDASVEVGANLKCTLVSKTPTGYKVTIENVDNDSDMGVGEVGRWTPLVEYPVETVPAALAASPAATAAQVPSVPRPPLVSGARVLVSDASGARVCVRPAAMQAQRLYDDVLQDVVLHGTTGATPLKEPPVPGQTVIAKFTDGLHYRAFCRRTNVKQNKYQLEYIEYGNVEVSKLEMLYECPPEYGLESAPPLASILTLDIGTELTPAADNYLEQLKEKEMILSLPDGAKTAPSGSVASLTAVDTNENVCKKLIELSRPDWKKIEERGGDIIEIECVMFSELEYLEVPATGGRLHILDVSLLRDGSVSGCVHGLAHLQYVNTKLAHRMAEYCNSELGRQPYLPKPEEMCIIQCPQNKQWMRAVLLEQSEGPGGARATVLYVDTGYTDVVPIAHIRKMVPEFVRGLPAVASYFEIDDFPADPTPIMLSRARQHMKIDETGCGELLVTKCVKGDAGMYRVVAKDLLLAMADKK